MLMLFGARTLCYNPITVGVRNAQETSINTLNVGVLLSENSTDGNLTRIALEIALEEINERAGFLTGSKLALHFRYPRRNAYDSALAAIFLFKENVISLLGPEGTSSCRLLSQMGEAVHVPVVSFTPPCPSLVDSQHLYFARVTYNDAEQMAAISAIIRYYGWSKVIVLADDNYGDNAARMLCNELDQFKIIIYKALMSQKISAEMIQQELRKLAGIRSKVFVVIMPAEMGYAVLSSAFTLGMLDSGYAWIVTNDIAYYLDTFLYRCKDNLMELQGILGTQIHIPTSLRLKKLKSIIKTRWLAGNIEARLINGYALFAYDALWAVAHAVQSFSSRGHSFSFTNVSLFPGVMLPVFNEGHALADCIFESKFIGITGHIELDGGDCKYPVFEIVNFVGKRMRTVGYWSKLHGFSNIPPSTFSEGSLKSDHLGDVIWPGGTAKAPLGWVDSTLNGKLSIAVPWKKGFRQFVHVTKDESNKPYFQGFCIDVFEAAVQRLDYDIQYEFIAYGNRTSNPNYTELVVKVAEKEFDGAVGDITITATRKLYVAFTEPFLSSGVAILVKDKTYSPNHALASLAPFSLGLWILIMAFVLYTGFTVCMLEHRNVEFHGDPKAKAAKGLWFIMSTFVAHQNERVNSFLGRSVVVIWLLFVLIIKESYRACLTSILTVESLGPDIDGLARLVRSHAPIGFQAGSFVEDYIDMLGVPRDRLHALSDVSSFAAALTNGPDDGGVAAIVDELPYLTMFLSSNCDFQLAGDVFRRTGWGFVFPIDSTLGADISNAILSLSETDELQRLYNKWLRHAECETVRTTSTKLDIGAFWGLFSLTGLIFIAAVICHVFIQMWVFNKNFKDEKSLPLPKRLQKFVLFLSDSKKAQNDCDQIEKVTTNQIE